MSDRRSSPASSPSSPKRRRYNLRNTPSRRRRRNKLAEDLGGRANPLTDDEYKDKLTILKDKKAPGKGLVCKTVNAKFSKYQKEHNTDEYECSFPVYRRGREFKIDVSFDRKVDIKHDCILLQFVYGSRPNLSKGTIIRVALDLKGKKEATDAGKSWKVQSNVSTDSPTTVSCFVTSPANACIGYYSLSVETKLQSEEEASRENVKDLFALIFNPWCKDDSVYMKDDECRNEYVMNDSGSIWVGNAYWNRGRPWEFGQFDNPVLEAALYLLDTSELGDAAKRSPVAIIRMISSYVNCNDNDGILWGKWGDPYPEGTTKPWKWTGSVGIIKEYMETKQPVRYGQCWVFSGVSTTICRALGIPTRSVTNFESAHDTDCSMTIDKYYDKNGEAIEDMNEDSVWNFHVWNESWCKRPDLPVGYDGWQAHDATPQETSGGIMRCGPASVKAIKEGLIYLPFDGPFIFAEVNGDKVMWEVAEDGTCSVKNIHEGAIGKNISTKAVGSGCVDIVTGSYKFQDGSPEERRVAALVNKFSEKTVNYDIKLQENVDIEVRTNDAAIGDTVKIGVNLKNGDDKEKNLTVVIRLYAANYTGITRKKFKEVKSEEKLGAGKDKTINIQLLPDQYVPYMNPEGIFNLDVCATNSATGAKHVTSESIDLSPMPVEIKMEDEIVRGEESDAVISFTNTLPITMNNCSLEVACTRVLKEPVEFKKLKLRSGETWTEKVKLEPYRRIKRSIYRRVVAEFQCNEVYDAEGTKGFKVIRNDPDSEDEN